MSVTTTAPPVRLAGSALASGPMQLANGLRIWFRPIRPDDASRLQEFHRRLSPESQRLRFFSPLRELRPSMARWLTTLDFEKRVAIVASYQGEDAIRAVARYEVQAGGTSAELAFVVEDAIQGEGVGKMMLHLLARHAKAAGIETLIATVLPENRNMLSLLESCGYPTTSTFTPEAVVVHIDVTHGDCNRHQFQSA